MGIDAYNNECRSIVMRYSTEWRTIVERFGRWIDFDNDYKTMSPEFMESVWYVFKTMYDKGLVYRGCKVMPYSTGCSTVLSNFEATQNYQDVNDPSIWITFPLLDDLEVSLIAWTTTPWTLPSNLALAVNPEFEYVKIKDLTSQKLYILAKCRLGDFYKSPSHFSIIEEFKGKTLEGKSYLPLFEYFSSRKENHCFQVLCGDFVTSDTGTGIVHMSPAYGDDDYKLCTKYKIIPYDDPAITLDGEGRFNEKVQDYKGMYFKAADPLIKKRLKSEGRLIKETQMNHSYPFCWRSDTPLIYMAQAAWFIKVTDIKEQMIRNNQNTYWVPNFAREKRFHNWLENAQDWCFSRSRCWGNPIPLWVSKDYSEIVCIESVEQLKKLSGYQGEIKDLHREFIDKITIPSQKGNGTLKRIEEVFDCWFESGSMPYAQVHYPFAKSKEEFLKGFPADFIGEGLDQTRGWFYTLNVISQALFNDTPYKNLIVNGLVLAQDGKKMSKRLKNYPDPVSMLADYGADAVRLYLINSPLVRAETLNFKQEGVKETLKEVFIPWFNAYRFLIQNISRWETKFSQKFVYEENIIEKNSDNFLDKWIIASCQRLIEFVRKEMSNYKLDTVSPEMLKFLNQLTNWYVRLNRSRIKGELGNEDWTQSLNILFNVILNISTLLSPFIPFITDMMFDNLQKCLHQKSTLNEQSIHFLQIPQPKLSLINLDIENSVQEMQKIVEVVRNLREIKKISLKQPIMGIIICHPDISFQTKMAPLISYLKEELNIASIEFQTESPVKTEYKATPDAKALGKKLGKQFKDCKDFFATAPSEIVEKILSEGKGFFKEFEINLSELTITKNFNSEGLAPYLLIGNLEGYCVVMDSRQDAKLKSQGCAREIVNRIQKLRKKAGLVVEDKINIFVTFNDKDSEYCHAFDQELSYIQESVKKPVFHGNLYELCNPTIIEASFKDEGIDMSVIICKQHVTFNNENMNVHYLNSEIFKRILLI